jgi:hypothetical protein
MGFDAGDVNFYAYVGNNPINANDPSGKAGVFVQFGGYSVDTGISGVKLPLGHAGVMAIDEKTGGATYYDFGRYDKKFDPIFGGKYGAVRGGYAVGTVRFDEKGMPTDSSMSEIRKTISLQYGKGNFPNTVYAPDASSSAIVNFAEERKRNLNTNPYSLNPFQNPINNCYNFAFDALQAGRKASNQPINQWDSNKSFNDGLKSYPSAIGGSLLRSVYAK